MVAFTLEPLKLLFPRLSLTLITVLLIFQPDPGSAQEIDDNEGACYYLDIVFSSCWTERSVTPYTASPVADCVCTAGGVPDPNIDAAVPACSSYVETAQAEDSPITSFGSGYEGYCSSYAPSNSGDALPTSSAVGTDPDQYNFGAEYCQAILNSYIFCQEDPYDLITEPQVASCLCHDSFGGFTTAFDDLLTPCYDWAVTSDEVFATEVSLIFGFCIDYGTVYATPTPTTESGPRFTFTAPTSTRSRQATLTFSQVDDDAASSACETVARIANACRTDASDPLTRAGVANCICQDPSNTEGAFGTVFDQFLTRCYPYARTKSPDAASEILSLSGYCTRFADGGRTYTATTTSQDATETITDDIFETQNSTSTQTTTPNMGGMSQPPIVIVAIIAVAVVVFH